MKNLFYLIIGLSFTLSPLSNLYSQGNTDYLTKQWDNVSLGTYIGSANILCNDFDGDGSQELLFNGSVSNWDGSFFTIYSKKGNGYAATWTSPVFPEDNIIDVLQVYNLDNDDDYEIYVVQENGEVTVYSGDSMNVIGNYQTISSHADQCKIDDINGDGIPELVIVKSNYIEQYLHVYNAVDLTLLYQIDTLGGKDIEIGDVDGDGQKEIILSDGYVLDGSTYAVEWQYIGGFGDMIELGDADSDTIKDIIGTLGNFITSYSGVIHSPIWQFTNTYGGIEALKVTYENGICEIIVGNNDFPTAIASYDALTQEELWTCRGESSGITNIGIGDPDNDGVTEFIWGSGSTSSGPDYLNIGGFDSHNIDWQSKDLVGHFSVSTNDINNDDTTEIVMTSNESNSGYDPGEVLIFNGITHNSIDSWVINNSWSGSINCVKTGNIDNTPEDEIVVGFDYYISVYNGKTHELLKKIDNLHTVRDIELADVDNDNTIEIIVGDASGYITVYDGKTYEQEWQSIKTGNSINDMEIADCDNDNVPEIIFCNYNSIIQIYDGITHTLQWQSTNINNVTTIDVCDYNKDGIKDIAAGQDNGDISFIQCSDFSITDTFNAFSNYNDVKGLKVGYLDSTSTFKIIVGASSLKVFDANGFQLLWESDNIGSNVGMFDNIQITDLDNDQHKDLFVGTSWGIFQFKAKTRYPDITPPKITYTLPQEAMQNMGTNIPIQAQFSELMNQTLFNDTTITLVSEDGTQLSKTLSYDSTNQLIITPDQLLPANKNITVLFTAYLADTAGNGLDGNNNGISEGTPLDDFTLTFTTGNSIDTIGPYFSSLTADSYSKWAGISISVDGILTDSSGFANSPLVTAEYFIDNIGISGEGNRINPTDHTFDEITEEVAVQIPTANLTSGSHTIYFHGKDLAGNWGEFSQLAIKIETEQPGSWPMYGNNPLHTGYNAHDSISLPFKKIWTKSINDYKLNQVCIVNDKIIISGNSAVSQFGGILQVTDLETGDFKWKVTDNDVKDFMPPAFGYGNVYLQSSNGSSDSYMIAYNIFTGEKVWQTPYNCQWDTQLAPTIANNRVFFNGGAYGGIYSFDAYSGYNQWFYDLPQFDLWTPAYYNDTVYAYTGESGSYGYLAALHASSGTLAYDKEDIPFEWWGYEMNSSPVIDTLNRILIVTSIQYMTAIDMDSKEIIWNKSGGFKNPAIYNNQVFSIHDGKLNVYDILSGDLLWEHAFPSPFVFPPVIANNYVFVSTEYRVYAFNITTHNIDWTFDQGGHITVAYDYLVIAGCDHTLYAFESDPTGINELANNNEEKAILYQNYPNPVSGSHSTVIEYYLPKPSNVTIKLYNINGIEMSLLENDIQIRGEHSTEVKLNDITPGMYFYKLFVNNQYVATKKMLITN